MNPQAPARDEFVTVSCDDPEFRRYLSGAFSTEYRALPVRSLNINRANEKVTFQLVRAGDVAKPPLYKILAQIFRLDLLTLTLTPAAAVAALVFDGLTNPMVILQTLVSLTFLHGATFCRNDFVDHMRGVDRLNEKGGRQVIQRGWLRAVTVQRLYFVLFAVAVLMALPVLLALPELFVVAVVAAAMGVLGYSHLRWGFGHWAFGDLAVFLCLGPLLAVGMSWVVVRAWPVEVIILGLYFGMLALTYVEVRHTISIVVDDEAGLATLPVRWGFDRAKVVIVGLLVAAAFLGAWLTSTLQPGVYSLLGLPFAGWIFWIAHRAFAVTSPLSSRLYNLPNRLVKLHFVSGIYFILMSQL